MGHANHGDDSRLVPITSGPREVGRPDGGGAVPSAVGDDEARGLVEDGVGDVELFLPLGVAGPQVRRHPILARVWAQEGGDVEIGRQWREERVVGRHEKLGHGQELTDDVEKGATDAGLVECPPDVSDAPPRDADIIRDIGLAEEQAGAENLPCRGGLQRLVDEDGERVGRV